MKHILRRRPIALFSVLVALALGLTYAPLWAASCATVPPQAGSEAALIRLQNMMRAATPPTDDALARLENENANTNVAALARLARAQVAFARNDFNSAVSLLDAASLRLINTATAIGDEALFTRADALARLNRPTEARAAFEQLAREYTESPRARDAMLRASQIAVQSGAGAAVPLFIKSLTDTDDAAALLLAAQAYEATDTTRARAMYRRLYFYAPASDEARAAALKLNLAPNATLPDVSDVTSEEAVTRADKLLAAKQFLNAANAYTFAFARFPALATASNQLKRGQAAAGARRSADAVSALRAIPTSAAEHAEALYTLALVHTRDRQWDLAKSVTDEARRLHPRDLWTAQALVAAGTEAKARGFSVGAQDFFRAAVTQFPDTAEVAGAQFELAWAAHERKDYAESSRLLIEHLADYADKNTDNRGRAGYWAGRDSQLAGRSQEAAALYNAMLARYDANWYGYLSKQRLDEMKRANQLPTQTPVQATVSTASSTSLARAVANLRPVTVATESADTQTADRAVTKAEQLAAIKMDDAAFAELRRVSVDAPDSPRINLAIARLHQMRFEMVEAFSQLRRSFPDYSQMKPEEMTADEWTIFYPLSNWQTIKTEAAKNSLDPYTVAGLIRQESVYNPRAASPAKAYGLMQLLIPTAQTTARRAGIERAITVNTLFEPNLNIQLGTAYMREQFDKFARLEYVAAAYNAGPGRAVRWRAELPLQIDEWAEAIPFRETRGYVQGVIRNKLQYQRLYDEQGRFRSNVGTNASSRLTSPPMNNMTDAATESPVNAVRPRRTAPPEE